ncbi:MAG TPA: cyclic nucleotide-binding domain-containing protein [Myxococcota bacterium]|nr:cyclic nucleotide-binding domain-containing protein [Myxococcota bacterium]
MAVPTELIRDLPLFRMVPAHHLDQAAELAMISVEVGEGELLLAEGERDDSLMVVLQGELEIIKGDPSVRIARVGRGEILGDMALFGGSGVRTATVRTLCPSSFVLMEQTGLAILRAHGNQLVTVLESTALRTLGRRLRDMNDRISEMAVGTELAPEEPSGLLARLRSLFASADQGPKGPAPNPASVLANSSSFDILPADSRDALADELEVLSIPAGTVLLQEGEVGDDAYVVAAGRVDVYRATRTFENKKLAEFGPGSVFGLVSLVHGNVRSATCYAPVGSWLLKLPGSVYRELEGTNSIEAQAMRGVVYQSLARQLAGANEHVALLIAALARDPTITERERAAYRALVVDSI